MSESTTREIPLRDIFLTIGDYLRAGLRFWWVLLPVGLAFAAWQGWQAKQQEPLFPATLTFVLNEDSGGPSAGGILSQLGIGGGGGGVGTTPDKVTALAKSQKIVHGLLLDTVAIDGVADRMANHLIVVYELVEEWELPEDWRVIQNGTLATMTEKEKSLLKRLHFFLLSEEHEIITFGANEDTGILSLNVRSRDQAISLALCYGMYDRLSAFYTKEKTGNSRATVKRLRMKADSIGGVLSAAEYELANLLDTRLGTLQNRNLVRRARLEREVQMLNLTYAEVLRNLETASFALSTQTPFFQTVDIPFSPLYGLRPNWKRKAMTGFLTGAFIGFLLVSAFKFYQDVMRVDEAAQKTTD